MHLTGYEGPSRDDDLKNFRQWDSMTWVTRKTLLRTVSKSPLVRLVWVFATPLVWRCAKSTWRRDSTSRMPLWLTTTRTPSYIYGCNMEGMSGEAASLAGHWGLGKLIVFYDDNKISIDGHTDISFTEDVSARYDAHGWHTQHVVDGNTDIDAIRKAIEAAKKDPRPSLIKVSTLIGYGSPNKADTHDVHGAPLGKDETEAIA